MYIRRKVFSLLQDETGEERYFSTTDVTLENEEERTFSVAEDAESLEEKDFSDKKKEEDDEPKLTTSDKINIKLNKALTTKKDREALVEAYEDGKSHKYGKQAAKYAAIGNGISGGILGAVVGGKKGAAIGAGIGAVSGAAAGTRAGVALNKLARKHSGSLDTKTKLAVDRVKVADGKMTKEEFAKKWRSKK
jgi:hypothetical protein